MNSSPLGIERCASLAYNANMKDELFNELAASVREGGAILRGERAPSVLAVGVKFTADAMLVNLSDGREISVP